MALPVAVGYDEFTADILPNRLVKAAARRLRRAGLRSGKARRGLGWLAAMLEDVSLVEFPATAVPSVGFDRLNEHCRSVVELSRLVLRHGAFEAGRGLVRAAGFSDGYECGFPGVCDAGAAGGPGPFRAPLSDPRAPFTWTRTSA